MCEVFCRRIRNNLGLLAVPDRLGTSAILAYSYKDILYRSSSGCTSLSDGPGSFPSNILAEALVGQLLAYPLGASAMAAERRHGGTRRLGSRPLGRMEVLFRKKKKEACLV